MTVLQVHREIPPGHRRGVVSRKVAEELRRRGLPGGGTTTIRVAQKPDVGYVRSLLRRSLAKAPRLSPAVQSWLLGGTKVIVAKHATLRWKRNGIAAAKEGDLARVAGLSTQERDFYLAGKDVVKKPGCTNVPVLVEPRLQHRTYIGLIGKWARTCALLSREQGRVARLLERAELPRGPPVGELETACYENFASTIVDPPDGIVNIPDDKSPFEGWVRTETGLLVPLHDELDNAKWQAQAVSVDCAEAQTRKGVAKALPDRFAFLKKGIREWPKECVPTVYLIAKTKCHADYSWTCTKIGHSCCLKIMSFAGLFGEMLFRSVHRGIQMVVEQAGTWAVWDISHAAPRLRTSFWKLRALPTSDCQRYHSAKTRPAGIVAAVVDAGQFYEAHPVSKTVDALDELTKTATATTGKNTVTVVRGRRVHGHLGGNVTPYPPHKPKFAVYTFSELVAFFDIVLGITFVRVGAKIFKVPHIPIGSPHGRAAVECIAGLAEHL